MKSPRRKIRNPKTGRMVYTNGVVGREILARKRRSAARRKSKRKTKRKTKRKSKTKAWNPGPYRSKLSSRCFLGANRSYPICNSRSQPTCQGLLAAQRRAAMTIGADAAGYAGRADKVLNKALKLRKKHGCITRTSPYRRRKK